MGYFLSIVLTFWAFLFAIIAYFSEAPNKKHSGFNNVKVCDNDYPKPVEYPKTYPKPLPRARDIPSDDSSYPLSKGIPLGDEYSELPSKESSRRIALVEAPKREVDEDEDEDDFEEKTPALLKDEDIPNAPIVIESGNEIKERRPSIEDQIRTLVENRLVAILVRVNIAACVKCTPDDKRIILQLKMAKALIEGNVELAQQYSKQMNKYIKSIKGRKTRSD